jgi:hypothetical protein
LVGAPLQEREMFPVKPLTGVKVSVYVPECPCEIVRDVGEAEIEKSSTDCVNVVEELPAKFGLEETNAALIVWLPALRERVENVAVFPETEDDWTGVVLPSR